MSQSHFFPFTGKPESRACSQMEMFAMWPLSRGNKPASNKNKRKLNRTELCNHHIQVATLSQNGAGKQEVLQVGPHDCGDAACKVPSQGNFDRFLQNIKSAMDVTLTIRGQSMFCVHHKKTKMGSGPCWENREKLTLTSKSVPPGGNDTQRGEEAS